MVHSRTAPAKTEAQAPAIISNIHVLDPIRKASLSLTCAWKMERDLAVCSGIRTRTRNCLCSDFKGSAKPFMMLPETRSKFGDVCTGNKQLHSKETQRESSEFWWCFSTQMLSITPFISSLGGTSAAPAALLLITDRAGPARRLERRRCGKLSVSVFYLFFPVSLQSALVQLAAAACGRSYKYLLLPPR